MIKNCLRNLHKKIRYKRLNQAGNNLSPHCVLGPDVELIRSKLADHARAAAFSSIKHSEIAEFSSVGRYTKITHSRIGKFCAISWDCTINAISHPIDNLTISAFPYVPEVGGFVSKRTQSHQPVTIGHDVWIGANAILLPGINIGHGAVIGAGAVVTKDVPSYAVIAGVPAQIIRYRFDEHTIEKLLLYQWWNLPATTIRENINLFQGPLNDRTLQQLANICTS